MNQCIQINAESRHSSGINALLITSSDTIRHEFFHLIDPQFNKAGVGAKSSVEDRAVHHVNAFLAAEGRAPRASYVVPLPGMAQAQDIPIDTYHQGVLAKEMPGGPAPRPGLIRNFPEYESKMSPVPQNSPEHNAEAKNIDQYLSTLPLSDSAKTLIKEKIAENMMSMTAPNTGQDQQLA